MSWMTARIDAYETHVKVAAVPFTLDEINEIEAYKIDLITTDEIRVIVSFGRPENVLELSEEQAGLETFVRIA